MQSTGDRDAEPGSFDGRDYRDTLSQFCTGVVVVTGRLAGKPYGFAAQSFTSVSLEPPLVAVCPAKTSTSWPKLRETGHFCINVLAEEQKPLCEIFARSGGDKFAEITWYTGVTGAPILEGVLAYIECELEVEHDAGDHVIALGRVLALRTLDDHCAPLLFFRGGFGRYTESA